RGPHQAFAERLQHHDALAPRHYHPGDADHLFLLHRIANDRKRLLTDLIFRGQIIGCVAVTIVDCRFRHEALDIDRARTIDRDAGKLVVFDDHILILADGITFDLIIDFNDVARLAIDHLTLEAVAGRPV